MFAKGEVCWHRGVAAVCWGKGKEFRDLGQAVQVKCGGFAIYLNVRRWVACQIMQTQLYLEGFLRSTELSLVICLQDTKQHPDKSLMKGSSVRLFRALLDHLETSGLKQST